MGEDTGASVHSHRDASAGKLDGERGRELGRLAKVRATAESDLLLVPLFSKQKQLSRGLVSGAGW